MAEVNSRNSKGKKENKKENNDLLESMKAYFNDKFKEMFSQHEENIKIIISANTKITNDRIDMLNKKIDDFQESLEFTENQLNDKINDVEEKHNIKITSLENKIKDIDIQNINGELLKLRNKVIDLEDRSRRNNLRMDGIKETENETWEECERKVKSVLINKLGIGEVHIERAHRGGYSKDQKGNKRHDVPRSIVFKLLSFRDKSFILKNANKLKDTGIYINEDFCKETNDIRKSLWPKVKELRLQNKYAYIQYNRIISRDHKK